MRQMRPRFPVEEVAGRTDGQPDEGRDPGGFPALASEITGVEDTAFCCLRKGVVRASPRLIPSLLPEGSEVFGGRNFEEMVGVHAGVVLTDVDDVAIRPHRATQLQAEGEASGGDPANSSARVEDTEGSVAGR